MRVLVAGERAQDREQYRLTARGVGLECAAADAVPLAGIRSRLAREPAVHLVLVATEPDPAAAAVAIKEAAQAGNRVAAVVPAGDLGAEDLARRAGAADVWPADRLKEGLLSSAGEGRAAGEYRRGRVVAVTAAYPGAGVTTVASGLAFGLAGQGSVLLSELGSGAPELALALDVAVSHSLAELVRARERMDVSMVRRAAVAHPAGVDVLAYQPELLAAEPLTADVARDFEILLRTAYDWVVLDTGHPRGDGTGQLLKLADAVVVVTRLDAPSLRRTRQYLRALADDGVPAGRVDVAANRYGQAGLVPWRKAEEALKVSVKAWLPDDPKLVNQALTDGRPLAQAGPRAGLTRELGKLAAALRARTTSG